MCNVRVWAFSGAATFFNSFPVLTSMLGISDCNFFSLFSYKHVIKKEIGFILQDSSARTDLRLARQEFSLGG